MNESKDVMILRESFLKDLYARIDSVFENRPDQYQMTEDKKRRLESVLRDEEKAKEIQALLNLGHTPDDIIVSHSSEVLPNEISVDNSHDYETLLRLVVEKACKVKNVIMGTRTINIIVDGWLEHEFAHHLPIIGNKDVTISYKVAVYENYENGGIDLQPSIGINGKTNLTIYLDVIQRPTHMSPSDLAKITELKMQ